MASGWESKILSSNPGSSRQHLTRVAQKIKQKYSHPYSVPLMIAFGRGTLKDSKKE